MRRAFFIGIILAAFVVVGISVSSKHLPDGSLTSATTATTSAPTITLAAFSDSYHRGVHTLSGALITPTPCYAVSPHTELVPSTTPSLIELNLSVPTDTGRCLELSATTTFRITQRAPRRAVVSVFVNGALATSTGTTTVHK